MSVPADIQEHLDRCRRRNDRKAYDAGLKVLIQGTLPQNLPTAVWSSEERRARHVKGEAQRVKGMCAYAARLAVREFLAVPS